MDAVPVWATVEILSFGTLPKAVAYRGDDDRVYSQTYLLLGSEEGVFQGNFGLSFP